MSGRNLSSSAGALVACLALAVGAARAVEPKLAVINAPYVTTPQDVIDRMLALAGVGKNDTVYDLGCGDGRIVITAATRYGARGVGIDIDPRRIREAVENARRAGVSHLVEFREQDLFDADLRGATVVTVYLLPDQQAALRPMLQRELRPGTRVVSHSYSIPGWKPEREVEIQGCRIFRWTVPAR